MLLVRILLTLVVVIFNVYFLKAQWQGTNPVYFNAGNVGIGTSTPSYKLQVHGNSIFGNPGSDYDFTTIDANGNLGIGTQPFANMALSIKRYANVTAGIRFENTFSGSTSFAAMQMGQAINVPVQEQKFLNILYASSSVSNAGVYQANGSTIFNNGSGGISIGTDHGAVRFFAGGYENMFERMRIDAFSGNVGIGTKNIGDNNYKLFVEKGIRTRKVKVDQSIWPDYVFHASYKLRPLSEVEQYIQQHRHLPDVPSAEQVKENGLDLGDNQATLLRKIEELTLYLIELKKENANLKQRIEKIENKN